MVRGIAAGIGLCMGCLLVQQHPLLGGLFIGINGTFLLVWAVLARRDEE